MNTQSFWNVIVLYNQETFIMQFIFFIFLCISLYYAIYKEVDLLPKLLLGVSNLYIGITYFYIYGTEKIQYFFAGPLFIAIGVLFIKESITNSNDKIEFSFLSKIMLVFVLLYPLVSFFLGHKYPMQVLYLMPCPLISLSIVIYSQYQNKNKILEILMIIWGLTGFKSFFFSVYEDIILLITGLYGIYVLFNDKK